MKSEIRMKVSQTRLQMMYTQEYS